MRGFNQEICAVTFTHGYSSTVASGADVPISGFVSPGHRNRELINTSRRVFPLLLFWRGYNGYVTDETRFTWQAT